MARKEAQVNAVYKQRGEALDYTNTTNEVIPANAVVAIGKRIGVTSCPIAPDETGSLFVCGVYAIPKTGTADIAMGAPVYFDGKGITDTAGDVEAGYAAAPATASDEVILVKLNG